MASEDPASEAQIKRLYAVLHSLNMDPAQWKKDRNIASYAKLTRGQCSDYIEELEAVETEKKGGYKQEATVTDGDSKEEGAFDAFHKEVAEQAQLDEVHAEAEIGRMAVVMRFCVREARAIVEQEVNGGGLSEASRAQAMQKLATTMFIESMKRGLC